MPLLLLALFVAAWEVAEFLCRRGMALWACKLLFGFFVASAAGWLAVVFVARIVAWLLNRLVKVSIGCRAFGWNYLRDITITSPKGAVESVCIGEIKLGLRKSLLELGVSILTEGPQLQFQISDLDVVLRQPAKSTKKKKPQTLKSRSSSFGEGKGTGKWKFLTNVARLFSISVVELRLKVPKAAIGIKDLKLDLSKTGGSDPVLHVKLHLIPLFVQTLESEMIHDDTSVFNKLDCGISGQYCSAMDTSDCSSFLFEDLAFLCKFGHQSDIGVKIRNLDLMCGPVVINLEEKLFAKKKTAASIVADNKDDSALENKSANRPEGSKLLSLNKQIALFPEKVSFNMSKLDLKFLPQDHGLSINNEIGGISLRLTKSQQYDDSGEAITHLGLQTNLSDLHLLMDGATSVLEVLRVATVVSVDIPTQPTLPIRAEVDVKIGGTQCNVIISRFKPLISLNTAKKKPLVLRENPQQEKVPKERISMTWTCTVSAPELTIVLYSLDDIPLYHCCSQSTHLFTNKMTNKGTQIHAEFGELNLTVAGKHQQSIKENMSGSLFHVTRATLDLGQKDSGKDNGQGQTNSELSANIAGMRINFCFQFLESLSTTMMSYKVFLKSLRPPKKRAVQDTTGQKSTKAAKGGRLLKISVEHCSITYVGDMGLEDMTVADPKRVNFGSQGGRVVIGTSADGTPRMASVKSTTSDLKHVKFSTSLEILQLRVRLNKEKQTMQVELERSRLTHKEDLHDDQPAGEVTLFDVQKAKFVRRSGGLNDVAVCSLINVTNISVRWEPDPHLELLEVVTRLKSVLHRCKLQNADTELKEEPGNIDAMTKKETLTDHARHEKTQRKRESVIAIDVELLKISAELADGVEAMVQVQSIFSENAKIGVLLEGLALSFIGAQLFRSSSLQISRIPVSISDSLLDKKLQSAATCDWVIQCRDAYICMPFRLQLRAIDDAVEDTLRALKLISAAKTCLLFPEKNSSSSSSTSKKNKSKSMTFRYVRFIVRGLTAEIEEEPIQGWLDEHIHLMKAEICESTVRLKLLDELASAGSKDSPKAKLNALGSAKNDNHPELNIDASDILSVNSMREEIHKRAFQSYYQACQKLSVSEGSGAYSDGFQSGFKLSTRRASVMSISAKEVDISLSKIDGGDEGMINFIKSVDPICAKNEIPFSRLYGSNFTLNTRSLSVYLRDYTFPLFAGTSGKCDGRLVLAQQATCFQPQIRQDVYVGKWWRVNLLRSASGFTPPVKTYADLPLYFQKGEVSFGVGYEPVFADISYAFTVALRRANLGKRGCSNLPQSEPPKRERSLPWWDDMRNYIHGKYSLCFTETKWHLLATTNPYEKLDQILIISSTMDINYVDGYVSLSSRDLKAYLSSLESLAKNCSLEPPCPTSIPFLETPSFFLEIAMEWQCDSGNPMDHYLFALPVEGEPRKKVLDPFRSTSLSLKWSFSLKPCTGEVMEPEQNGQVVSNGSPTVHVGAHDLAWLLKWWNLVYLPPHKLRMFSRWPRFGVPRIVRSGNLALDKVMTEQFLRFDAAAVGINNVPLRENDAAEGLILRMTKLKYELGFSRGKQLYTFDCKREPLDLVYQGLDLHLLKVFLKKSDEPPAYKDIRTTNSGLQPKGLDSLGYDNSNNRTTSTEKSRDEGFLLYSDYFTIRRQTPKADSARLSAWQEAGRKNSEMPLVKSEFDAGGESDRTQSDLSDEDGFNVVVADNCQRVFVYGLKILWNLENRDAIFSWVGGLTQAFQPPKLSPSRQYAQRKILEKEKSNSGSDMSNDGASKSSPLASDSSNPNSPQYGKSSESARHGKSSESPQHSKSSESPSSNGSSKLNSSSNDEPGVKHGNNVDSEEGTRHFMVNVIQPQFNLHSEETNGRFLLAAASGRVLVRSFHSVVQVGQEMIEKALGASNIAIQETKPEMTWSRVELSLMLEHVQAHVAPTDVDPGAGIQWLPKILRRSSEIKRTGALLERVFMPCQMYFRYTRHKGGTPELKVKPLKELTFTSPDITAAMTSRQFQVMLDVLTNLLFAHAPRPHNGNLCYPLDEEEDDIEEASYAVVPDGDEEVELAKIKVELKERERKVLIDDIRNFSAGTNISDDSSPSPKVDDCTWVVSGSRSKLVKWLKKELTNVRNGRKEAFSELGIVMKKAAQLKLMEKEKNKSPSCAMRISMKINKVVWSMLADGKSFAEAEINDMIYDFDRDYKDIGISQLTTKLFLLKNGLASAKSDTVLSPWNPPAEWGKNAMLRVNAKQGAPTSGNSVIESFLVDIYPLKIYLTEAMYRMMWGYFFPEDEQHTQKRQEVFKVSTITGSRRIKKSGSVAETSIPGNQSLKEFTPIPSSQAADPRGGQSHVPKSQNLGGNTASGAKPEIRRTSSFDRTWEETVAESIANELVSQVQIESQDTVNEDISRNKTKDSKPTRPVRSSREEKKTGKPTDEKSVRPQKMMDFRNIKISQVELLLTYEGLPFNVNDVRLLMDTFHREDFTGTWARLFSRVKKHIIWGVLKSVTGMQGKKFKAKSNSQKEPIANVIAASDFNISDSEGDEPGNSDQLPAFMKKPSEGAGDGFATSIKGLFKSQQKKAKAFVLKTMRGEADRDFHGEWSENEIEFSPFARQLTITKTKKLIRRHTKKFRSKVHKKSAATPQEEGSELPPQDVTGYNIDSSDGSPSGEMSPEVQ